MCLNLRRFALRIGALGLALALGSGVAPLTAIADEPALPDLGVTANWSQRSYRAGETINALVHIVNNGTAPTVANARFHSNVSFSPEQWGDLDPDRPGIRLDPEQMLEVRLSGTLSGEDNLAWLEIAMPATEANNSNNYVEIRVPIGRTTGNGWYAGTVFADTNDDGAASPGEGLNLVQVSLVNSGLPPEMAFRTTDAQGRFEFGFLPIGEYRVHFDLPGGWVLLWDDDPALLLTENSVHDAQYRASRPMPELLNASMAFTKSTYAVGERAALKITLTNTGTATLTRIFAVCSGARDLNDVGPLDGLGPLADFDPGVTLRPGESRTFDVSGVIPEQAGIVGWVFAACTYGPPQARSKVKGQARARVPGLLGTVRSVLVYDRNADTMYQDGEGVADTKIVLADPDTGALVARTRSDATGHFEVRDIPAGTYEVRPIGPWRVVGGRSFQVLGNRVTDRPGEFLIPGPVQPDPDATPAETPAPQGDVLPATETAGADERTLAATGASPTGLIIVGLAAVLVGIALVFAGRRRRDHWDAM